MRSNILFGIISATSVAAVVASHAGCASTEASRGDAEASSSEELGLSSASPSKQKDMLEVATRGDVKSLPLALRRRLVELAGRPHSHLPTQAFAEADKPSQLFQYYLLDAKSFEPNVFTSVISGINDNSKPTATGANHGRPTIGAVRVVLEPKDGKPTDPSDPGAFIDMFTDISGLFVINNESGWYEGWMIHDLVVPAVGVDGTGKPAFGKISAADAAALAALGSGNNVPGHLFTTDGDSPRAPSASDHFPNSQTNLVALPVSTGSFNAHQQSDIHAYWEFNQYTNWTFPLFEIPTTGGIPGTWEAGKIGALSSLIPGSGPAGVTNLPKLLGDNPNDPRDPDRAEKIDDKGNDRRETRNRFLPSGLANEVLLDVFARVASFEPGVAMPQRLYDAYAHEVAAVDLNHDGVLAFNEVDEEDTAPNGLKNERLYLPATAFNRFAVTRELNDGLLAPRFAPSQRAYVMSGAMKNVFPAVPASQARDADDR